MIRFFLERPILVHVITIAVLVVGFVVVAGSQREGFPTVTINEVIITSQLPGASPQDVESKVVQPIEEAVESVDGVESYHSVANESIGITTVELYEDFDRARVLEIERELQKAIDGVTEFPSDMEKRPTLSRFDPVKMPVIELALSGPPSRLRPAAKQLDQALERIPTVSEVTLVGYEDPEIEILVDPVRARAQGITLDEVIVALQRRNVSSTGGKLTTHPTLKQVVVSGEYESLDEIEDTILRFGGGAEAVARGASTGEGGALRLRDVARVRETTRESGLRLHSESEESIHLIVRRRANADILDTVDAVRAVLDAHTLPDGVAVHQYNDSSQMTRNRLEVVITNGVGGVILVLLVLLLFLSRRIAFWVAFGLPFCLLGVAAALPFLGISINMVSLAGFVLVIGIVVDDAIIIAERVAVYLEAGLEPIEAAVKGAKEMAKPVIGSSLTTILAFAPLYLLGGIPGKFSWAIPTIVILTLFVSLFECFFILPAHLTGGRRKHRGKAAWILAIERRYQAFLIRVLPHAGKVILVFVAIFVLSVGFAVASMKVVMFPQDDADALYVKLTMPVGTPLEQTEAVARQVERQIPRLVGEDLAGVTARIGHHDHEWLDRDVGSAEHEAHVSVFLTNEREHGAAAWRRRLREDLVLPENAEMRIEARRIGPPMGKPVTVHVAASDDVRRRLVVNEVRAHLESIDAVTDVTSDERDGIRQVDLELDYERLALKRVGVDTVSRTVKAAFHGLPVTEQRTREEPIDLRVRFEPAARSDLDLLLSMPVRAEDGRVYPLRDLVTPVEVDGIAAIHHRDGIRTTTVSGELEEGSGETATSMAARIESELLPRFHTGDAQFEGVEVRIGGEATKSAETLGDMPLVLAMAFIGIVMVVMLLTESLTQALFVVSAVPLGMVGVIWAYHFHGIPVSLFALLGVTGLSGVVVNDSIVMVTSLNRAATGTMGERGIQRIAVGATGRLRPVLLTTLTTVAGVMPTAYGLGGRDALLSPMSLALGYGLIFATTITLIVVPSLYVIRRRVELLRDRVFRRESG